MLRCGMPPSRVAALYDIHGNLPALEAVLLDVRAAGADEIVVGGDVVPGPMPRESLARLLDLDLPVHFIRGNGDREVIAPTDAVPAAFHAAMRWNAEQLSPDDRRRLAGWPLTTRLEIAGVGAVLFCHATPRNDTDIFTRQTSDDRLRPIFATVDAALAVCGHTHMQFDRMLGAVRVVNAGSVGMPFGEPGAYWLLLGPQVELRRTGYDLEAAAARIRSTGYPQAEEFAARNVLQPPSEETMLAMFAPAELK
jgi:predicted phosphodiesterase